jgi:hypothetical protein
MPLIAAFSTAPACLATSPKTASRPPFGSVQPGAGFGALVEGVRRVVEAPSVPVQIHIVARDFGNPRRIPLIRLILAMSNPSTKLRVGVVGIEQRNDELRIALAQSTLQWPLSFTIGCLTST